MAQNGIHNPNSFSSKMQSVGYSVPQPALHSNFVRADFLACIIARRFSEKLNQPFFVSVGYFPNYDLRNRDGSLTYEIKLDSLSKLTGRMCFELEYNGEPSGLTSTKALFWLHVVPISATELLVHQYLVSSLREAIKGYTLQYGGDYRRSKFVCIPSVKIQTHEVDRFVISYELSKLEAYW